MWDLPVTKQSEGGRLPSAEKTTDESQGLSGKTRIWVFAKNITIAPGICLRAPSLKVVTALSPLRYEKRVRLLHARSLLIAGRGNATSIALGVGYESPNQFSRECARLFGLPPSRDLAPRWD
jgi:hypothetical protein